MPKNTHHSSGSGSFHIDINMSDFTDEITDGIKAAIERALIRIGDEVVSYAGDLIHNVTGNLRRSLTKYVEGNAVYVGTNCEYGGYVEEGPSRSKPHPYLRPAAEGHIGEWKDVLEDDIGLRLNQSRDSDIINYLEATGAPLQTIRRLVRDEIARTGWNAAGNNKQA